MVANPVQHFSKTNKYFDMKPFEKYCKIFLYQGLKARGNVEDWLGKVEEAMFASVKRCMKASLKDYVTRPRVEWVKLHANQVRRD